MSKVVIIGAAGYVGKFLVEELIKKNHQVISITRDNGKLILSENKIEIRTGDKLKPGEHFDAVINLAYPTSAKPHEVRRRDKEIFSLINSCVSNDTRIIHTSTIAVFGYPLNIPIEAKALPIRREDSYVESKLYMENLLLAKYSHSDLHIVRLGNVWGPGSTTWTVNIVNKLFFGEPVAVKDQDGYCNLTDVRNVASYLSFLLSLKTNRKVTFHHLAEFSHLKWSYWISKLAPLLKTEPVYAQSVPYYPVKLRDELKYNIKSLLPSSALFKNILKGRFSGSFARSMISILPPALTYKLIKTYWVEMSDSREDGDASYYVILTSKYKFSNVIAADWTPPVDEHKSLDNIKAWMQDVGFLS